MPETPEREEPQTEEQALPPEYDAADPELLERRRVEILRQGMASEFWGFLEKDLRETIQEDVLKLADPKCPVEMTGYLRGRISRANEFLLLPQTVVGHYDSDQALQDLLDGEQEDIPPSGRRASPVPNDLEE